MRLGVYLCNAYKETKAMTRSQIKARAIAAGLTVREEGSRTLINRPGKRSTGIVITESGSIYRSDVVLEIATRLYPSGAMKLLGI